VISVAITSLFIHSNTPSKPECLLLSEVHGDQGEPIACSGKTWHFVFSGNSCNSRVAPIYSEESSREEVVFRVPICIALLKNLCSGEFYSSHLHHIKNGPDRVAATR
jgi:hypothetical protein